MLGNAINYLTDKRKRLAKCDTAPSIDCDSSTASTNQMSSPGDNTTKTLCELELASKAALVNYNADNRSESREPKPQLHKLHRASSPPSNIKYKVRHKASPSAAVNVIDSNRKFSDTTLHFVSSTQSRRSRSIDHGQKSKNAALKIVPMNDANMMKLSRSFSKRMPRSGSAKNLTELRDDSSLVWNDGKLMQREISALYKAIESNDLKTVESVISAHPGIVNIFNNVELSPLDVAMLYNYSTVAKRLIESGGKNNEAFENDPRILQRHLTLLTNNCASQILEMCGHIYGSSGSINRDIESIDALHVQLTLLKNNFEQMKPGSIPRKVVLEVAGLYSLLVTVYPPSDSIVTRYKIEWSRHDDFREIDDEIVVRTQFPIGRYQICDLVPHIPYYIRVRSINLKGAGPCLSSSPLMDVASCWTESMCGESFIGMRRAAHPQEWCVTRFDQEEMRLEQQLHFWLTSIKDRNKSASATGAGGTVSELPDSGGKRHIPGLGGKKSLLKTLFSSSSRFVKQPKCGLYLCLVYKAVDNDRILTFGEEQLPFVLVDEDQPISQTISSDSVWLMRLLSSRKDLRLLVDVIGRLQVPVSLNVRVKLLFAVFQLQLSLGCLDLGLPCCGVIHDSSYTVIVLTRQIAVAKQLTLATNLKWSPVSKLSKSSGNINDSVSSGNCLEEELYSRIDYFNSLPRRSSTNVEDGLYLGYVRFKSTLDHLYIQQHVTSPSMFPVVKIRDNWHVDKDEWSHFLSLRYDRSSGSSNAKGSKLQNALVKSWPKLQTLLKLKQSDAEQCRLYLEEILWLKKRVSVILVVPSIEDFCGVPGQEIDLPLDYEWCPLHAFEFYHFQDNLAGMSNFSNWATLNSSLDVLYPLAQHCLRQGFDQHEIDQSKERLEQFQSIQNNLEHYWKSLRWSVDVINNCRDKQASLTLTIGLQIVIESDSSSQAVLCTEIHCPDSNTFRTNNLYDDYAKTKSETDLLNVPKIGRSPSPLKLLTSSDSDTSPLPTRHSRSPISRVTYPLMNNKTNISNKNPNNSSNNKNDNTVNHKYFAAFDAKNAISQIIGKSSEIMHLSATDSKDGKDDNNSVTTRKSPVKGTLRIYAGYPCGLLSGTSVKILLNSQTTVLDVIKLIVNQLNATALSRNPQAPQYSDGEISKFCLVVTIDKMSRPLPDNFHPLLLKQPWKSGKLTVNLRSQTRTGVGD